MKYWIPIVVVLLGVGYFMYFLFNGDKDRVYTYKNLSEIDLVGYMYEGKPTHPVIEKLFFRIRDATILEDDNYMAIINYSSKERIDTLRQFIGTSNLNIVNEDSIVQRTVPAAVYVEIALVMNDYFKPSPGKVRAEAEEFAALEGKTLDKWNLEIYPSPDTLKILFPVITN